MRHYPQEQHEQMKHFSIGYFTALGRICAEAVSLLEDAEHSGDVSDIEAKIDARVMILKADTRHRAEEYQYTMSKPDAQLDKLLELITEATRKANNG